MIGCASQMMPRKSEVFGWNGNVTCRKRLTLKPAVQQQQAAAAAPKQQQHAAEKVEPAPPTPPAFFFAAAARTPRHLAHPTMFQSSSSRLFTTLSTTRQSLNSIRNNFSTTPHRYFHATAANMVVKAYFDCSWTGPQVKVDAKGKVVSSDNSNARK